MVTTMKKYIFLVLHREYQDFLVKLGNLGILHIIGREKEVSCLATHEMETRLKRIENTIGFLSAASANNTEANPVKPESNNPDRMLEEAEGLHARSQELSMEIDELNTAVRRNLPWGNYTAADFKNLTEAGYKIYMYTCPEKDFQPSWNKEFRLFEINRVEGQVYFLILAGKNEPAVINAEQFTPSKLSVTDLRKKLEVKKSELSKTIEKMAGLNRTLPEILKTESAKLERDIALQKAYYKASTSMENKLRILEGWVPRETEAGLLKLIEQENIVGFETKPENDEKPPVKLENSKFSKLFEPISNLFDLPSYKELDLTPYFAPFFLIFFGFCLGDAGYGIFFILFASILKLKLNKKFKPMLSLAQYLGIATIAMGLLSGTFFGINLIDSGYSISENSIHKLKRTEIPVSIVADIQNLQGEYFKNREDFFTAVQNQIGPEITNEYKAAIIKSADAGIPMISNFRHLMQDPKSMFYLSIIIGGLQILFGIILRIVNISRQKGFRHALSTLGWLILIISTGLFYAGLFANKPLTILFYTLVGISGLFIFIFNNPDYNVFMRVGAGIWDSYGMVTGLFGDLLSYIRLFALGISSSILGFVFNDISYQLLSIPYVGWLMFLILLIIGHSINLFMATLGAFIHPMRLTFVEFYKNAGFQGGGKKYNPFRLNINHN
jgi:V/A-type H+-transporting ATPase subunit I